MQIHFSIKTQTKAMTKKTTTMNCTCQELRIVRCCFAVLLRSAYSCTPTEVSKTQSKNNCEKTVSDAYVSNFIEQDYNIYTN